MRFNATGTNYPEAYFHYALGYMLPAFAQILSRLEKHKSGDCHFVLESYGPVMDEKFVELLDLFRLPYSWQNEDNEEPSSVDQTILLSRWDNEFLLMQYWRTASTALRLKLILKGLFSLRLKDYIPLRQKEYLKEMKRVREAVLSKLEAKKSSFGPNLLLDRLRSNEKYDIQVSLGSGYNYGYARRALTHLEPATQIMNKEGWEFDIYNPGESNYLTQILAFRDADNVVTIRGAELANIFWMREGTKVVEVDGFPGKGINTSPAGALGRLLNLNYEVIRIEPNDYPELKGDLLKEVLNRLSKK